MSVNDIQVAVEIMVMAIIISVILLFLGIGFLILMHVCIVGRAIRTRLVSNSTGQRQEAAETGGSSGITDMSSTRMSKDDVEKLPSYDYSMENCTGNSSSTTDCAVCLENFKTGEKCRLLPVCNHSFHAQCVDSWLLKTPICPICRTNVDSRKDGGEKSENVVIELTRVRNGRVESVEQNNQVHLVDVQLSSNPILATSVDPTLQPSIV